MNWLQRLTSGWSIDEEREPPRGDPARIAEVAAVIEELRPMFAADGGEVQLVAVEDGWVVVRLRGACRTCSASELSIHGALEPRLKADCTWVRGVRTA